MTTEADALCKQRERQRQAQQTDQEAEPPQQANRIAQHIAPTATSARLRPRPAFADTLAHAGRDEPLSTDFALVRTKQLHAVQRN